MDIIFCEIQKHGSLLKGITFFSSTDRQGSRPWLIYAFNGDGGPCTLYLGYKLLPCEWSFLGHAFKHIISKSGDWPVHMILWMWLCSSHCSVRGEGLVGALACWKINRYWWFCSSISTYMYGLAVTVWAKNTSSSPTQHYLRYAHTIKRNAVGSLYRCEIRMTTPFPWRSPDPLWPSLNLFW